MAAPNAEPAGTDQDLNLSTEALIERYAGGTAQLDARVLTLTDEQLDTFFLAQAGVGRWSCRVLVGHLADAELLMVSRMRRVASEQNVVFTAYDHEAMIDAALYAGERGGSDRPVAGSVAVVHSLRLWTSDWLRSLDEPTWQRRALHPEDGPQSLWELLQQSTAHLEHHAQFLVKKLDRLLGEDSTSSVSTA